LILLTPAIVQVTNISFCQCVTLITANGNNCTMHNSSSVLPIISIWFILYHLWNLFM